MELWIRSQDKEMLAKVNRIDIGTNGRDILINGFETIIGKYTKKERALEVLNDIQEFIEDYSEMRSCKNVYKMPQE